MSAPGPLRAPTRDGAVVAEPPLREVGALLTRNQQLLRQPSVSILGRPLANLQRQAREAALQEARQYLDRRGEPISSEGGGGPLLVAGHQPELFHPGVWVKNFAWSSLARLHGGTALNLIVDNDTVKSTSLRLPSPAITSFCYPHALSASYDRWPGQAPYEEEAIRDREWFEHFADRVLEQMRGWGYEPLLASFWPEVLRQTQKSPHPGECFAAARRVLERRWGCHNLELPLSRLCGTEPFAWFACHLLAELPRFQSAYNACVKEYRHRHGIRSHNHPVPELAAEGDFFEAPLWGWRQGQKRRGRLFARIHAGKLQLRSNEEDWPTLPAPQEQRMDQVLTAWQQLAAQGYKIRSRALTTTLYSRLFLADLFMHGIGGGHYDELTDMIWRQFYHTEPPGFLVLSATCLLPLPAAPVQAEDRRRLLRQVRDVRYNPERFLPPDEPLTCELVERKRALLAARPGTRIEGRRRFRQLRALTEQLRLPLREREQQLRRELVECERQLKLNAVLRRRDYSFCLYPETVLRPFCTRFLEGRDV